MGKETFQVVVIEDDAYARDMMVMLLARDYRTQVVEDLSSRANWEILNSWGKVNQKRFNKNKSGGYAKDPDLVILDTEVPGNVDLPLQVIAKLSKWEKAPKLLCTATHPNIYLIEKLKKYPGFAGYVIKNEVMYALASAACLAAQDFCVITPSVRAAIETKEGRNIFPTKTLVIRSTRLADIEEAFNVAQRQIILLGLVFNLPKSEIHDELNKSESVVRNTLHEEYTSLQILEVVSGKKLLSELFEDPRINNLKIVREYETILQHLANRERKQQNKSKSPKIENESTLAFHLFTKPEIEEWPLSE